MRTLFSIVGIPLLVLFVLATPVAHSQETESEPAVQTPPETGVRTAPVIIDGEVLLRVRGVTAFPAEERAARIASAILEVARDPGFDPETLRTEPSDLGLRIMAGERLVMTVVDADARVEGVLQTELASVYLTRVRTAIRDYRGARTPEALRTAWISAAVAVVLLALSVWLVLWLWRHLDALLERRLRRHVQSLEDRSFRLLDAERVWGAVRGVLRVVRLLAALLLVYVFLQFALARLPWTRGFAAHLADYVIGPLDMMGRAVLAEIPDLIFLAILFVIVRWALRLVWLFFDAVRRGAVKLSGFEAEWATPTYRLIRLLIVAFTVVVAYPYIPGSNSAAFKGISLFLGVVFSLGSTSAISNTIAGYLMTYRRAFRVGDRIRVGELMGDVSEIRLQVTHLRTPKNEEVIVPNSTILNSEVVNYSTLAQKDGLILHTTVAIGYDTPWRQVEAMLLLAARRTPGLNTAPPPFVLQKTLGDFAVTYELNAYCQSAQQMFPLYSELHRNILDVFNEYGVAIMTPSYEGDPAQPKLVPRERWFDAPAAEGGAPLNEREDECL